MSHAAGRPLGRSPNGAYASSGDGVSFSAAAPCRLRDLGGGVEQLLVGTARPDHQDRARPVTGTDEDVIDVRRHVHEVPGLQRTLLAVDEQRALAGQHEEVLLEVLPVVEAVRLARLEHADVDSELLELAVLALEDPRSPERVVVHPARVAQVRDAPLSHYVRWK